MQIRDRIKELRRVAASELRPNPKNWRTHPKAQQEALRGVLAEVGIADAVLARELPDGSLMLVDGHLRAETMPGETIPVLVLDVDEAEADKILATLDPLAAMAEADSMKLDALLREVQTGSEALAEMLTDLAQESGVLDAASGEVVEDESPEPPVVPITKPGDLWLLGRHRLLCGDSTKAEDVGRLMAGAKADLCFTSPPYNAAANSSLPNKDKYEEYTDNVSSGEFCEFLCAFTKAALPVSEFVFVNIQSLSGNKIAILEWLYRHRDKYADVLIWDKEQAEPAMAGNVTNSRFEFVFVLGEKANRAIGTKAFRGTVDNLVRIKSRQDKEFSHVHKATYPIAFAAWGIGSFCADGGIVYEPFCGSGTTLIAAEQLNRTCYGMEISPQYCDVIVQRWETLTGQTATLEVT